MHSAGSHGPYIYSRNQLLVICNTAVHTDEQPNIPRELKGAMLELSATTGREFIDLLFSPSLCGKKDLSPIR